MVHLDLWSPTIQVSVAPVFKYSFFYLKEILYINLYSFHVHENS